jgi:hypothetical protein
VCVCLACQVIEVRGGSVLFEPGAVTGNFVGVYFADEPDTFDVSIHPSRAR